MTPLALGLTLLFGALVGVVSGLVGVGGGIVMVPLLYFWFAHPEWSGVSFPSQYHAVVAHATSLFVIVPTAIAGLLAYHRSRLVAWRVALPMAATAILAAMFGVQVAIRLPPEFLKAGFGAFLFASGLNLLSSSRREEVEGESGRGGFALAVAGGILIGFITSLLGVGGGIVAIPLLIYLVRLEMKKVAATSLGIVVFSAFTAAVTYAISGWTHPELPAGSIGYVYLPAGLALLPGSVLMARYGVRLNRSMDPKTLKVLFGVVFLLVGLRLFVGNIGGVLFPGP
ncbi:MAG: sulfite exporter TauE/SafE family protein [Gemmatimonadota bacterium]|jgi:uncharacterized membrane protein YfcA